jgi:hypothetical protein
MTALHMRKTSRSASSGSAAAVVSRVVRDASSSTSRPRASSRNTEVDAPRLARRRRIDLGGEVEVVDRRHQQPRLADDLMRPLTIRLIRRTEILPLDDLGEADDCVQRCLDLVDQLPKRIRIGRESRLLVAVTRFVLLAKRNAAVAGEPAVCGLERRNAADLPLAGKRSVACQRKRCVAEWGANGEGAHDLRVEPVAFDRPGDRSSDHCAARRAVDPGDFPTRSAFPSEQPRAALPVRGRSPAPPDRGAAAPAALDALDNFVQRRRLRARALLGCRLDQRVGEIRARVRLQLGMKRLDEPASLLISRSDDRAPLNRVEGRRGEHGRSDRQTL